MAEKISVIIITRNREKMLSGCLESLVKQTRLPDEVVVVDNASTDNTKKVVLSFKKKLPIKYFLEEKVGIPFARNKGLQHTTGALILMLDDDCSADSSWVEKMIDVHKKYPKAWVVQGRTLSLPKKQLYSLAVEFSRLLYIHNYAEKVTSVKSFLRIYFTDEIKILMCETENFSIKTPYLKKFKLSFDTNFYQGEDKDLARQIMQKNGLIMFCPEIKVYHYERSTLLEFLKQQWQIGKANAKIEKKWGKSPTEAHSKWSEKPLYIILFCKAFNVNLLKMPMFILILFLDKFYRLNGYFFEKSILAFGKRKGSLF